MARTTAPLLGFEASGAIAKTMVYGKWRGVRYARRFVIPANPRTAGQTQTRSVFAMLRELWKLTPGIGRAPWDAFASGRRFLGLNAFVGENMRVLRTEPLMTNFIGSPGARGGLSPASVVTTAGFASGSINVTVTTPTLPSGWTFLAARAVAFPDQNPQADFAGKIVSNSSLVADTLFDLNGLGSGVSSIVAAWLEFTKPNGQIAYSVGVTTTQTSAV